MKKENIAAALAAVAGIPVLLLIQQWLIGSMEPPPLRHNPIFRANEKLMAHTESGLKYSPRKAHHTASAAAGYMRAGELQKAENWLKLGASVYRYPSMMLFYGDYLVQFRRYREAARWYSLAADHGRKAGQHAFAAAAVQRIKKLRSIRGGK